mgnify:CR=1 FL=1
MTETSMASTNVTAQWHTLREGLYHSEYRADFAVSRTTIVQLSENRYLVYSPGKNNVLGAEQIIPASAEVILLAPAYAHISGIQLWAEQFDHAQIVATDKVAKRLGALQASILEPESLSLPNGISLHVLPENRMGEVWLQVTKPEGEYLLVCDALLNLARLSPKKWVRAIQWLYGLRLGLRVTPVFRKSVANKPAYRDWYQANFSQLKPLTLIPCHGEILAGESVAADILTVSQQRFS